MKLLVTGADGFVGRHLVHRLSQGGHQVVAACQRGHPAPPPGEAGGALRTIPLEVTDDASVRAAVEWGPEGIVHLAAVASGREARNDPGRAWSVNAAGTARIAAAVASLRERGRADPVLLLVSTAEVYGAGSPVPRLETDPLRPQSPYAASKVGAEVAALEAWRRAGVRAVIARPFPHTGPGQTTQYVVPAFVARLRAAKESGADQVPTGNLEPVRDLLDVRDVVGAYLALLAHGVPGEAYNIARGEGWSLGDLFRRLAELMAVPAVAVPDPSLVRSADIAHLVGDATKIRRATGWAPAITLEQTLRELVDAEAD
ncbi:MAG: GDP-mannose 4,6-dehydratase [Gemmatimonadales bacterium]|nr:GDP-mannose 4,6-dehydratase [Gemmatimonadales bacterium]